MVLLALLVASMFATGFSVVSFFVPGAVVAAVLSLVFYAMILLLRLADHHERVREARAAVAAGLPPPPAEDPEPEGMEVEPDLSPLVITIERTGLRVVLTICIPLAVAALVLATIFVGWDVVGLGALAIFAAMIFMGAPVWLAAVEDEIEEAQERVGIEHPPSIR